MLKVFLVEDEFVVRQGIKNKIDWKSHGYEFCGEASDGELAYPMIQKLKPDIVITDIRMPFMDGLVLSRLIKKEMPWVEIIILTGYEEFEYAKEAIKIGVAEYLTKPINSEELLKEVDLLADKIEEKRREQEIKEKYMLELEENSLKERKELFQHLVTGGKSMAELLETADRLDMDLSAMWYNIVLIKIQFMNQTHDEYSNILIEIEERMKTLDNETNLLIFDRNLEGKAFLFKADSKEELEQIQKDYIDRLKAIWADYENVRYFGGVGEPVNRLRELPGSFEAASHAFAHRYLVGESLILSSRELEQRTYGNQEEFNIRSVNPKQIDRSKMQEFLKMGDKDEVVYFIEEFFHALDNSAMNSSLFRQYITMDAYFCVSDFTEGLGFARDEIDAPDAAAGILKSKEDAVAYVVRILTKALELREKAASNRYGDVVDEVKRYIEYNFADEDLSLNLLASHVNFSPNHLSTIFSQQTGQTFTGYLTDYRMNKAKELLRCTSKRSSEIGLEVGYKDPHYFSYLFKKTQGMTPTQYRSEKTGKERGE
ncbi:response regulator [Bariatricus massiliensis]|uniref:Stage 0 sporulation protein A homolog n=1 Tax=Bariatricus massiliensis TaxID=1745713 RepID=A0ABS8DEY5_9FIRM|nr:response regulator [Bariatricus massiliensis]MCB7303089.1 response regulator [Bariatricus massiliensis]MCB7374305.1 response regulator [Bariatricus massiliensis]MCB7386975.1 response regulator [Bariatricus massiliensis]MCB7411137.1 response regulator [Bariatricus massiliensis]MCQ5251963.1 response regulator [Bariatricus massiliensis]